MMAMALRKIELSPEGLKESIIQGVTERHRATPGVILLPVVNVREVTDTGDLQLIPIEVTELF